jgi:hypothetical protein
MPSVSPPTTPIQHRRSIQHLNSKRIVSPHRSIDLGSSYASSQSGHSDREGIQSRGHRHSSQRLRERFNEDDEESSSYELVKTYESGDSVLPTYSPSSSMSFIAKKLSPDMRSVSLPSGMSDIYKEQEPKSEQGLLLSVDEDSRHEKRVGSGRYAKLIPEQRPPRMPVSCVSLACL